MGIRIWKETVVTCLDTEENNGHSRDSSWAAPEYEEGSIMPTCILATSWPELCGELIVFPCSFPTSAGNDLGDSHSTVPLHSLVIYLTKERSARLSECCTR
jgi:hypothetical protein